VPRLFPRFISLFAIRQAYLWLTRSSAGGLCNVRLLFCMSRHAGSQLHRFQRSSHGMITRFGCSKCTHQLLLHLQLCLSPPRHPLRHPHRHRRSSLSARSRVIYLWVCRCARERNCVCWGWIPVSFFLRCYYDRALLPDGQRLVDIDLDLDTPYSPPLSVFLSLCCDPF
jgi:hypothetical protein